MFGTTMGQSVVSRWHFEIAMVARFVVGSFLEGYDFSLISLFCLLFVSQDEISLNLCHSKSVGTLWANKMRRVAVISWSSLQLSFFVRCGKNMRSCACHYFSLKAYKCTSLPSQWKVSVSVSKCWGPFFFFIFF